MLSFSPPRDLSSEARDRLDARVRHLLKRADLGSDPDSSFEQSFASLAYTYLKERVPRIMDHVIGFQLLDRNEKKNKAVGLFGFKLGELWTYGPVFFRKNGLKGHEIQYLKDYDLFLPLSESWVNYLLAQQPENLGKGSPEKAFRLGAQQPDLSELAFRRRNSGGFKFGSARWHVPPVFASLRQKRAAAWPRELPDSHVFDLTEALQKSFPLLKRAWQIAQRCPEIKRGFDQFYGPQFFRKLGEHHLTQAQAQSRLQLRPVTVKAAASRDPVRAGRLRVLTRKDAAKRDGLLIVTQEQREVLILQPAVIDDQRTEDEVSKAYTLQGPVALENPNVAGMFQIVLADLKPYRCAVFPAPIGGHANTALLIDEDGQYQLPTRTDVYGHGESDEAYKQWFDDQSSTSQLTTGGKYVAVTQDGRASVPFEIEESLGDGNYAVRCLNYSYSSCGSPDSYTKPVGTSRRFDRVRVNGHKGTKLHQAVDGLLIPEDAKIIKVRSVDYGAKELGDGSSVAAVLTGRTDRLKTYYDGTEFELKSAAFGDQRLGPLDALISLVQDHGLKEAAAKEILQETETRRGGSWRIAYAPWCLRKKAYRDIGPGGFMTDMGSVTPTFPEPVYGNEPGVQSAPAIYSSEDQVPVDALEPNGYDQSLEEQFAIGPDWETLGMAQEASRRGTKDVFDASLFTGLLRHTPEYQMIDQHIGKAIATLDSLGRWLVSLYWHAEEFEERYGKNDLPELEDSLQNNLESLGKLTLFLAEKSGRNLLQGLGGPDIDGSADA